MTFDLYAWAEPRVDDVTEAMALTGPWIEAGADPAASPFEPSTDVAWFFRELTKDLPLIDAVSVGAPNASSRPIWLETDDPAPARVVAIRLSPAAPRAEMEEAYSLAMKYDLVLFDARTPHVHHPLEAMSAYASATFWPRGAIRSVVAGLLGAAIAYMAWSVGVPIISGIAIVIGLFLVLLTVVTLGHEIRERLRPPGSSRGRGRRRG